jgi:serine/threonine protein kinase
MTIDYRGQQLGSYRLLRLLGRGGFADVYLGEHIHLKSLAAIKVLYTRLADELEASFLNEARILAHLTHPHIIRVLDYGLQEGVPFLVMEYAPHGTLRQRHPRDTHLDLTTVVDYVRQIADGLQYAHDQKLIHRDLKPENLLIGQRDELLLSDFGVALIAQTTRASASASSFAGTAAYMAPEQLQGKPVFASDQYSLGIMVYEWLCGTRPFQGTFLEMYSQHMSVPPAPLHNHAARIPPAVEEVVLTALAKDPGRRFASVRAFATAFEQASQPSLPFTPRFSQSSNGFPTSVSQPAFPRPGVVAPQSTAAQAAFAQSNPPTSEAGISRPATRAAEQPDATPSVKSGIIAPFPFAAPAEPGASPDPVLTPPVPITPLPFGQRLLSKETIASLCKRFFHRKMALIAGLILLALLSANIALVFASSGGHKPGSAIQAGISGQSSSQRAATTTPIVAPGSNPIARATIAATATHSKLPASATTLPTASHAQPTVAPTRRPEASPTPAPQPSGSPTLVYSSSLSGQDGASWDVFNYSGGGGCGFSGGAYHAAMPQTGHVASCIAEGSSVSNFIYQAQMTVLQGDGGGLIFRSNSSGFYRFRVSTDGTYDLVDQAVVLVNGSSPAIKTGAGQTNILKVVARGNALSLYVNGQLLTTVHDSASSYGRFGVFGVDFTRSTDAAFSNARVWQL